MKTLIQKLKPNHLTKAICLVLVIITFAMSFWSAAGVAPVATGIGGFLVVSEFLASVCRSVKSGYGFWKHTLIGRLVLRFVRKCKYIARYGASALQNIKNDPKQLVC